ncbi:MAG: U2 snRNP complex subunit msl1 [Piccolia ochrophora]|nr:MAG: U2 snRNP complex subunit msl1 [Piccolia ochrophora]
MPSRTAAPPQKSSKPSLPPNQTLYINNLPSNLRKPDITLSLYTLFSTYGPVLDVVVLPKTRMRGQAHVVFRDVHASTQAMRSLQSFDFFGKALNIQYAKTKSDAISKLDGTYRMPAAAAGAVTATDLQQSIFNAPPSAAPLAVPPTAPPGLKPPDGQEGVAEEEAKSPQGVKRRRDDESDDEEAPMEEDDEGDASMEDSSDEE